MTVRFNSASVRDDIVDFSSQIGIAHEFVEGTISVIKRIPFEKVFVNIDTDGGNSLTSHFHSKMPHRKVVTDAVITYLSE